MRILITGICGFVGSALARSLGEAFGPDRIFGVDNLIRSGSHLNRAELLSRGIRVWHGDIRLQSDLESLPAADWVLDAAANPSVMAGVDGQTSSRQLLEHNLNGTLNLLEYCKRHSAGFLLLSTSRVYSVSALSGLPVVSNGQAFELDDGQPLPGGVSRHGISEEFSTAPPVSLYGNSKLCSESLALEYGAAFNFPVWINRCGVLAGAGQFGKADQGIFSYWIHAWRSGRPLKYIGFNGSGLQVRDAFHPTDLARLLLQQLNQPAASPRRIWNVGGGAANALSLLQLSRWCSDRLGPQSVARDLVPRPYDIPWLVMDDRKTREFWAWAPGIKMEQILEEIAQHATDNRDWLKIVA